MTIKIVLAPDSFKDCLRSAAICEHLSIGVKRSIPDADVLSIPMADGGQGTVEAVIVAGAGELVETSVHGPLGEKVIASYARLRSQPGAVVEMASAAGLELVPKHLRNPMNTSTFGVGELMLHALSDGCSELIIGLGGSSTNDGGAGMAMALGYRLLDDTGADIPIGGKGLLKLARIVPPKSLTFRNGSVKITSACDVRNPLLGPEGATRVYGPQKGATVETIKMLEDGLANLAERWEKDLGSKVAGLPGAGAAGGLGGGLMAFCGASFKSGAELLMETTGLVEKARGADLLVTGEGCTDSQTLHGKTVMAVLRKTRGLVKKTAVVSGSVKGDLESLRSELGVDILMELKGKLTLEEAIANAGAGLEAAGARLAYNLMSKCD